MKRLTIIYYLIVFIPIGVFGQNLIPNGSFEPVIDGHAYADPLGSFIYPWFANTESAVFEDYYTPIAKDSLLKYENSLGKTFLVIDTYFGQKHDSTKVSCHGYISTPLVHKLMAGHYYYFEIKIHVSLRANVLLNGFGALFTTGRPKFDSCRIVEAKPQIFEMNVIPNLKGWHTMSGIFKADESYNYLSLGVFDAEPLLSYVEADNDLHFTMDNVYSYFYACRLVLDDSKVFEILKKEKVIVNKIHFESSKYELGVEYIPQLDSIYYSLVSKKYNHILIDGYTDDIGDYQVNMDLSRKRADAIREYLVLKGIPFDKITCNGYGSSNPMYPNNSDENRASNRRVEINILLFD